MPALLVPPLALYVHFPWCVRKCPYCDFNSYTLHGELPQSAATSSAWRVICEAQAPQVAGRAVISVFLGGGTPSLFSPDAIARVLDAARTHLAFAPDTEITLEANPGTIERGAFAEYRAAGVTRVSLGAQSFERRGARRCSGASTRPTRRAVRRGAARRRARQLQPRSHVWTAGAGRRRRALRDVERALALAPGAPLALSADDRAGTVFAAQPPPLPDEDVAATMLSRVRRAPRGSRARALRGVRLRAERPAMPPQPQLLELRGLPGRRRRRPWQAHRSRRVARSCARRSTREPRRYLAGAPGELTRRRIAPPSCRSNS